MKKLLSLLFSVGLFSGNLFSQCSAGDVEISIDLTTDQWGYEAYWELVPAGSACGTGTIFAGGNTTVGCGGGGAQAILSGGYANNDAITEGPFCLTDGSDYDIIYVDDWGDGGMTFSVVTNGFPNFTGTGSGSTHTFTAAALPDYDAKLISVDYSEYVVSGGSMNISGEIKNQGGLPITAIDVTWNDGSGAQTQTISGLNIASSATGTFTHPTPMSLANPITYNVDVTLTQANDADLTNNDLSFETLGLDNPPSRTHVYEAAGGTWNPWDPRGIVGLQNMESESNAIGIAVHNGDPMVVTAYDNGIGNFIGGYPGGLVNRSDKMTGIFPIDPGSFTSIHNGGLLTTISPFTVNVEAKNYDASAGTVDVELTVTSHTALTGDYRCNVVLVENNIQETASGYNQSNAYASNGISLPATDVNGNAVDWENLGSPVSAADMNSVFGGHQHVARSLEGGWAGQANSLPSTMANGDVNTYTFTGVTIASAWDIYNLKVVGWVQKNNGEILNAAEIDVVCGYSSSSSSLDEDCEQGNGSAIINLSGGLTPYLYTWSNGDSGAFIDSLEAGVYTVTYTDATGCTSVDTITIDNLEVNFPIAVQANPTAGISPLLVIFDNQTPNLGNYTFTWIFGDGSSEQNNSSFVSHTYVVDGLWDVVLIAEDNITGCSDTLFLADYIYTTGGVPCNLNVMMSGSDVTSAGASNGAASVSVNGAQGNISYSWSNGSTVSLINGLSGGFYYVTVTDDIIAGCYEVGSVSISEPGVTVTPNCNLSAIVSGTDATAVGSSDGTASVNAYGGQGNISYAWSNGNTSSALSGLTSGNYTVTVTDDIVAGCSVVESISISEAVITCNLSITLSGSDVTSAGASDGAASASVSGGQGNISYSWSNGSSASSINGLSGDYYFVTVTDDIIAGCSIVDYIIINEPGTTITPQCALSLNMSGTNVTTNGGSDGVAVVATSGAQGNVTYSWSSGSTSAASNGLTAGVYSVTVADDVVVGCLEVGSITITEPVMVLCNLSVSIVSTNVTSSGGADGTAVAMVTGAAGNVTYLWSTSSTASIINALTAGTYLVVVTDDVEPGCSETAFVTITEPTSIIEETNRGFDFTVFPNPNNGQFVISFDQNSGDKQTNLKVTNSLGQIIYSQALLLKQGNQTHTIDMANIESGIYFVTINGDSFQASNKIIIK